MTKILIPTPLRKFAGNQPSVEVSGQTIGSSIAQLAEKYPELRKHLLDENDAIRSFVRIYLGDEDIKSLDGISTQVADGSIISIIPAIAGGIM
ncbi:MAG: MoaD/ThiS family protein [Bacteroidia bacterium]